MLIILVVLSNIDFLMKCYFAMLYEIRGKMEGYNVLVLKARKPIKRYLEHCLYYINIK